MEFPDALGARLTVLPRGLALTSTAPDGPGIAWTSRYGVVGMDAFGEPSLLSDGTNEAGLYAGVLYMSGFASYPDPAGTDPSQTLEILNTVTYALTTCASVAEVFDAFSALTVWAQRNDAINDIPPLHLVLHDATGASGVIEFQNGVQRRLDNPLGVATNSPYLDWHYNNVRNWIPRITAANPDSVNIRGVDVAPLSQGQGFVGLPGDSGSAARFLRATAYVMTLLEPDDAAALEMLTFHALNNFDLPAGVMTGVSAGGLEQDDQTQWSSIASLSTRRYIVRVQSNPTPVVVDLTTTDFDGDAPRQHELAAGSFQNITV